MVDAHFAKNTAYSHAITEENIALDDETHKRLVDNFLRVTRKSQPIRYKRESTAVSRNRSISLSPARKRRRSSTLFSSQWDMERRSISPLRDGDIWQAYRHMVDHRVRELNNIFNLYKSDPEEHPLYKENWEKFWKRRKDELITAGINHRTYNYQNEWILFFNIRLEELYNQEVENIKQKCRENLCLSMTNNNLGDPKYHVKISESDSDDIEPADEQVKNVEMQEKTKKDFKKIKVIHVLRLLTALEDHLGSLGAGVTELLSKALQTYKLGSDNADSILLNPQSCAILETAKEKFTGLILSKILDAAQERAVKQAINETRQLLKYAEQLNKDIQVNDESFESMCKYDASTTQKNEAFIEKTELATKLASSLISQGKSKINQDQLHQIVQVYSLFKQKKRLETPSARKSLSNLPPYQAFQNFNKSDQCRQSPYFQYDLSNNKRMSSTITNGSSMNTIVNDISANTSLSPIDSSNPSRHDKEYLRNGYNSSKQYGYQPPAYGESPMNITGPNNYRDIDYSGMNTNRTDRNPTWM
ncbi:uncharacterized protein CG7065 isoform X4 [Drosophila busckii]|uniref:uncharacterized protein CG7065 isoform X4 n=1 Tax=Drosophila busckii TaxID=30019 RepID=UPI00083ECD56|nr:uncharacterized protein CG7065 isoform X4 [Drosophila busckii]